jgi:uncharacterized protein
MPHVTCPTCRLRTPWHGNPHRPFCSLACRLIDLGVWLDERYRVPAESSPDEISGALSNEPAFADGGSPYAEDESADAEGWRVS